MVSEVLRLEEKNWTISAPAKLHDLANMFPPGNVVWDGILRVLDCRVGWVREWNRRLDNEEFY